jgi:hypothetical protein
LLDLLCVPGCRKSLEWPELLLKNCAGFEDQGQHQLCKHSQRWTANLSIYYLCYLLIILAY